MQPSYAPHPKAARPHSRLLSIHSEPHPSQSTALIHVATHAQRKDPPYLHPPLLKSSPACVPISLHHCFRLRHSFWHHPFLLLNAATQFRSTRQAPSRPSTRCTRRQVPAAAYLPCLQRPLQSPAGAAAAAAAPSTTTTTSAQHYCRVTADAALACIQLPYVRPSLLSHPSHPPASSYQGA